MESSEYDLIMSSQQFISTLLQKSQSNSPNHRESTYRRISSSEKSSPIRQTVQMKRKKYQKLTYDSKPISIGSYEDKYFAMEPFQSDSFLPSQTPKLNSSNMMPKNVSTWVSNSKRVKSKWSLSKKGNTSDQVYPNPKNSSFDLSAEGLCDMKDYIHSVKYFFMQHKRKVNYQRRSRVQMLNQVRNNLQEQGNLNIIKLKPTHHIKRRQTIETEKESSLNLTQYHSTNHLATPSPSKSSFSAKINTAGTHSNKIFRRKNQVKKDSHFIFGEYKTNMTEEAVQKLKILYYRDFLWKICFNRSFVFESTAEIHRYYVGKGNNSRLIRRIMAKRGWWVEDTKQQNAHFVWTQLKVYDVYKNQRSEKKKKSEKLLLCQSDTLGESAILLTSPFQKHKQKQMKDINLCRSVSIDKNQFILNEQQYQKWQTYIYSKGGAERNATEDMKQRKIQQLVVKKVSHKITNHLQFSRVIGNKKALYRTMQTYFDYKEKDNEYVPLTFHITGGLENEEYLTFLREFYKKSKDGLTWWIVKPGELSNRGKDIIFCSSLQAIKDQIKQKKLNPNGSPRTYIVQSYIHKPFLYQGRKFDLRHYLMITSTQGAIRGYFYQEGYVRTTSYPYSLNISNPGVHLTNDAVQKYLPQYSKYQKANKLSYQQLNEYMLKKNPNKGFYNVIFPQLKKIGTEIIEAAFPFVDPERRANNFQIFGIDVMIDEDYKCWLIEVNTNPCIEVNCPVLAAVIPGMLDNALTIGLDSLVAPPLGKPKISSENYLYENKFQLVFDQQTQGYGYQPHNIDLFNYGDDDDNYESCEEDDYDL